MATIRRDPKAISDVQRQKIKADRARAFRDLSDPLIGKLLRGEITEAEFQTVADKIRAANPYPEDENQ